MRLLIVALLLCLAACVAPVPSATSPDPQPAPAASQPTSSSETPVAAEPGPVVVNTACKVAADCAVKNIGNCCGYYPACVNVDSPTDPQRVQAECAKRGTMSVCGFPEISACTCNAGRCEAASGNLQVQ